MTLTSAGRLPTRWVSSAMVVVGSADADPIRGTPPVRRVPNLFNSGMRVSKYILRHDTFLEPDGSDELNNRVLL